MADIFSTISLIALVLAGICVIAAIALFFALNTKAAYLELKGQPQKKWVSSENKQRKNKSAIVTKSDNEYKSQNSNTDDDDEAVTTLDSGEEIITDSLMNVYEPGTDIVEESTELETSLDKESVEVRTTVDTMVESETEVEDEDIESETDVEDEDIESETDVEEEDIEPETEIEDVDTKIESDTDPDSYGEEKKSRVKTQKQTAFKITKKVVIVHSNELLR